MADLSYPATLLHPLSVAALPASDYSGARQLLRAERALLDYRLKADTNGTISNNNRVMVKPTPSDPEVPFSGARVRVHRLADGYLAWSGISDANGYYWPTGLEVGVEYYPVAIDLTQQHECDAAGPVVAVERGA